MKTKRVMSLASAPLALGALLVGLGACTTSDSEEASSGGSGGSSGEGGSSGSGGGQGGSGASAGSSGSSGEGGASGEGGTGGEAGTGVGGEGGSATAGVGGTGGASGGAAGTGGVATGGTGTGTSDRCPDFCDDLVNSGCSDAPTTEGCNLTCKSLASSDNCNTPATEYFDCVESATLTCNAQGAVVAMGCELSYLAAIGCAVNENPNPAIEGKCDTYCTELVAQNCPNSTSIKSECVTNCLWLGATGTGCDDEWTTYVDCANAASWTCLLGFASPQMCGMEYLSYTQCINQSSMGN